MSRKFVKISEAELREKVDECGYFDLKEESPKDFKVQFDDENFYESESDEIGPEGLMGIHTLDNGLTFNGMCAGGDWEHPVFFISYWDGKKMRAYVPTDGNPWNTDTKEAYGNAYDSNTDVVNAKKRWSDQFADLDDETDSCDIDFEFDCEAIKQDILNRFEERT